MIIERCCWLAQFRDFVGQLQQGAGKGDASQPRDGQEVRFQKVFAVNDDLQRFLDAQEPVFQAVLAELVRGRKRTHWMWFVFPQLAGLGHSPMARHFAIADLDEARRYLAHPVLGPRLIHCTELVNGHRHLTAHDIFGSPDDLKLRSSMTLFGAADPGRAVFQTALDRFYDGKPDERTLALLAQGDR